MQPDTDELIVPAKTASRGRSNWTNIKTFKLNIKRRSHTILNAETEETLTETTEFI